MLTPIMLIPIWIRDGAANKEPKSSMKAFLNDSYVPALTAYEYKGYIISAWARPESTHGATSVGIVYKRDQLGAIIQIQRMEGELFRTKERAEQHGVELCKEWIDKQAAFRDDRDRVKRFA
jgi:hypothetical protein